MPNTNYFRFAVANRRLITFGFLAAFSSSFGQTYFIGIFGPEIQTEFGLSHTTWGTIYLMGTLATAKGWSFTWITGSYIIYAVLTVVTSLTTGQLVDRLGAVRLVPYMLFPLILAMVVIAVFKNPFIVWGYMVLVGVNIGIAHTSVSAMWAELYGVHHLGAIRSMVAAVGVFGTALGPVTMGGLIDRGLTIEQVCLLFSGYSVFGMVLMFAAFRRRRVDPSIRNGNTT